MAKGVKILLKLRLQKEEFILLTINSPIRLSMLIINSNDLKNSISVLDALKSVEDAFILQESDNYLMPDRMHIGYKGNTLLLMPAFAEDYFSTKLVSVFPGNPKKNHSVIYGAVILNNADTGEPLALIDGRMLTAIRTGAIGGLGITYTTPLGLKRLGLIGAGQQGFHQILFACTVRNIEQVFIYDPFHKNIQQFQSDLQKILPHIQFTITKNVTDCIANSEAVITATTSDKPVIPNEFDFIEGKHFIGIGSYKPDMREYPDKLFTCLNNIIVDTDHAKSESGDIKEPLNKGLIDERNIYQLGKLINKEIAIDVNTTTFFKSVGMALFDLCISATIYKNAVMKGIGTEVDF